MWSRFESGPEGDAAWAAFTEYLHLATPRVTVDEFARSHKTPAKVLEWSLVWMWDLRVAAFDDWSAQSALRKNYPVSHPLIIAILRLCTEELKRYEASQHDCTTPMFSMSETLRMLKEVRAAERDIARLQKEVDEAQKAGTPVHDFSKLTLDEARQLDTLLAKVAT